MAFLFVVILGPALLTIGTAALTRRHFTPRGNDFLAGSHIPLWLLLADFAILALGWLLLSGLDDRTLSDGSVCKDTRNFNLLPLVLGSAVVGGFAWGSAGLQRDSSEARLWTYGAIALTVPYVIVVRAVLLALCGGLD